MNDNIKIGNEGEQLAADYLVKQGFEIVARNYRFRRSEIDLIVKRDNWIIFVEVKTRTSSNYGQPEEFVGTHKAINVFDAAEEYVYSIDWHGHIRFDIISVKLGRQVEIQHFEDAIH